MLKLACARHESVRRFLLSAVSAAAIFCSADAAAQSERVDFNLPAQPLKVALLGFASQARVQLAIKDELVAGRTSPAIVGTFTTEQALQMLLRGTGVKYQFTDPHTVELSPAERESVLVPRVPTIVPVARKAAVLPPVEPPPEELTVTGSRIRGAAPVGSELIRIDRTDIERQGFTTTTDIIRSLPQNNALGPTDLATSVVGNAVQQGTNINYGKGTAINLRGMGSNTTLLLVNGRRIAPASDGLFFDLSVIPIAAIERIDILADGASAIYGSDAVGGVANVILRRDFVGAETSLHYNAVQGGGSRRQAAQLVGTRWETGNAMLTYQYSHRDSLDPSERSYVRQDQRAFGGKDTRLTYGSPGTITANGTTYAIPGGQDGRNLSASALVPGTVNYFDVFLNGYDIVPTDTTHTAYLHIDQNVGDALKLFGDVNFNNRHVVAGSFAPITVATVPRSNPFFVSPVPGASSVSVSYSFNRELRAQSRTMETNYAATFGGVYSLPREWQVEASVSLAKDMIGLNSINLRSFTLAQALADTNPATALNLFGDGTGNNPATLKKLLGISSTDTNYTYRSALLKGDGRLFDLPAGAVRAAVGIEGRQERDHNVTRSDTSTELVVQRSALDLARDVVAGFAELFVPVFSDANKIPFAHRLDLSAAVRSERYSDFGYTTNPKLGLSWSPLDSLTFRTSYGHSFRAPLLSDTNTASNIIGLVNAPDPKSPSGTTPVLALQGGSRDLKPERAMTWTIGGEVRPREIPGLALDATYFKIDYTDRVGQISATLALPQEVENGALVRRNPPLSEVLRLMADPTFSTTLNVPPSQVGAIVDFRRSNLAKLTTQGLDLHASYAMDAFGGQLDLQGSATILFKYLQATTALSPLTSTLNTMNGPTRYRLRGGATYVQGDVTASLFGSYVNSTLNKTVTPFQRIDSWTTFDLTLAYDFQSARYPAWLQNTKISLAILNLEDKDPPYTRVSGGYDPVNANPYGRQVALHLTKRW